MNAKLKRYEVAALRGLAIRALASACPHLAAGQIAVAVGVSRDLVRYHVQGRSKAPRLECVVSYQQPLMAAAGALASGHFDLAARHLSSAAVALQKIAPREVLTLRSDTSAA